MSEHETSVDTGTPKQSSKWLYDDVDIASTPQEMIEIRRQATRRRVTYAVIGTLCVVTLYLVIFVPAMRSEALTGILGIAATAAGFYYGGQTQ